MSNFSPRSPYNIDPKAVTFFAIYGEADIVGAALGFDIWEVASGSMPNPVVAGTQMTVVSTSANDDDGNTGINEVILEYLDATGAEQTETITMNGTSPVNSVATDIRFVNKFFATSVGSGGNAVGTITLYKTGDANHIFQIISSGGNASLSCTAMVPLGKELYITSWGGAAIGSKPVTIRLRSTNYSGNITDFFLVKGAAKLDDTSIVLPFIPYRIMPPLAIIKISAWTAAGGGDLSAFINGYLKSV